MEIISVGLGCFCLGFLIGWNPYKVKYVKALEELRVAQHKAIEMLKLELKWKEERK